MNYPRRITEDELRGLHQQADIGHRIYSALWKAAHEAGNGVHVQRHPFLAGRYGVFVGVPDTQAESMFAPEPFGRGKGIFQVHIGMNPKLADINVQYGDYSPYDDGEGALTYSRDVVNELISSLRIKIFQTLNLKAESAFTGTFEEFVRREFSDVLSEIFRGMENQGS